MKIWYKNWEGIEVLEMGISEDIRNRENKARVCRCISHDVFLFPNLCWTGWEPRGIFQICRDGEANMRPSGQEASVLATMIWQLSFQYNLSHVLLLTIYKCIKLVLSFRNCGSCWTHITPLHSMEMSRWSVMKISLKFRRRPGTSASKCCFDIYCGFII